MNLTGLFKPVASISTDVVKELIAKEPTSKYCLLDVREEAEYEQGHLPGARFIPLGQLQARASELRDRDEKVVVYCRSGNRSQSAVSLLLGMGFTNVLNMTGGISAYHGEVASGGPDSGMFCFPETLGPAQLIAVAWLLEDGAQTFYEKFSASSFETENTLNTLLDSIYSNKVVLLSLFAELSGTSASDVRFPNDLIPVPDEPIMVGCIKVADAREWAKSRPLAHVLELMLALETNALDLYLKLSRFSKDIKSKNVFSQLASAQQAHLTLLSKELTHTH